MKKISLKKGKEASVLRKHPWIFSGAVEKKDDDLDNGDLVEIFDHKGNYLGTGFYFHSSLQVKILCFGKKMQDSFWEEKIQEAISYRKNFSLPSLHTNAFRCFFGEADGIPGLVADYYNEVLVLQFHHAGLHAFEKQIMQAFLNVKELTIRTIWLESENKKEILYSDKSGNCPCPVEILENNLIFYVDWQKGQKTGFFLDQRENRKKLQELSHGKTVLNLFCYTGAFSIYALQGGAKEVISVDISSEATEWVKKHFLINEFPEHPVVCEDVFDFLKTEKREFDIVICDPPAFAKSLKNRHQAIMAYKRLNIMAMQKVKKGGILMTFSCSSVVSREMFYHTLCSACMESKENWTILQHLQAGHDHPTTPFFPEGDYLKGFILVKRY